MTIFGKRVSEYITFQKGILWLIVIVALGRFALSVAGVPNSTVKWLSVTAVALLGLVYYAIRVHTTGFGSYEQLLPLLAIQSLLLGQCAGSISHCGRHFHRPGQYLQCA
jgi:hypothetical protein